MKIDFKTYKQLAIHLQEMYDEIEEEMGHTAFPKEIEENAFHHARLILAILDIEIPKETDV